MTFGELLDRIAAQYHNGQLIGIAKKIGLSSGRIYQWHDGLTKQPGMNALRRLSRAYGVDIREILATLPAYAPWLSLAEEMIAGAKPRRKTPGTSAAIRGGSDAPFPQDGGIEGTELRLIGHWLRKGWGLLSHNPSPWGLTVPMAA